MRRFSLPFDFEDSAVFAASFCVTFDLEAFAAFSAGALGVAAFLSVAASFGTTFLGASFAFATGFFTIGFGTLVAFAGAAFSSDFLAAGLTSAFLTDLALDTGLAVFLAAVFLAVGLEGMGSLETMKPDDWIQFTH